MARPSHALARLRGDNEAADDETATARLARLEAAVGAYLRALAIQARHHAPCEAQRREQVTREALDRVRALVATGEDFAGTGR